MCSDEVFGDLYRGCGHFVKKYYSGTRYDCMQPFCGLSRVHGHTAPNCPCPRTTVDERRILNMFQVACDACRGAEFDRRVGRPATQTSQKAE